MGRRRYDNDGALEAIQQRLGQLDDRLEKHADRVMFAAEKRDAWERDVSDRLVRIEQTTERNARHVSRALEQLNGQALEIDRLARLGLDVPEHGHRLTSLETALGRIGPEFPDHAERLASLESTREQQRGATALGLRLGDVVKMLASGLLGYLGGTQGGKHP